GLMISNASKNVVKANLITGNMGNGVNMLGIGAMGNILEGNHIGTDVTGVVGLGNGGAGVYVASSANQNKIGLPVPPAKKPPIVPITIAKRNTIAFNAGAGVSILSGNRNSIRSNYIFDNGGRGIEVAPGANNNPDFPMMF